MRYINIIILLGLAGLLYLSCKGRGDKNANDQPREVKVVTVEVKPLSIEKLYVTDIRAVRNVELRSRIPGFIEAIYVDEGQYVNKDQLLFSITNNEFIAEIDKRKARLNTVKAEAEVAEVELQRVKILTDKNIISPTELSLATSKLKAANARAAEARSDLNNALHRISYTSVRSPFDGVIDRIPLKVGALVVEGTFITSVSDISSMYAYFDVSENEYLGNEEKHGGNPITVRMADLILSDGKPYGHKGRVQTVVSEFDERTGAISYRASFPNPLRLLKHKATGKVKLITNVDKALVIPQKAAFEVQDKHYVYVVDSANVLRMRAFVPAGRVHQQYIIKSGLQVGERIVYEGIKKVKEGQKVMPTLVQVDSTDIGVK